MKKIAIIPARSGSKRIIDKNITPINGKPLIQFTLELAEKANIFDEILVSTDSKRYRKIIGDFSNCKVRLRPSGISGDKSPDIEWLTDVCKYGKISNNDRFICVAPNKSSSHQKISYAEHGISFLNQLENTTLFEL